MITQFLQLATSAKESGQQKTRMDEDKINRSKSYVYLKQVRKYHIE